MQPSGAAIVTTLRGVGDTIDSFITYHLAVGFDRLYLFFDDELDPELPRIAAHPRVTAVAHNVALRQAWTHLPEYPLVGAFVDREVIARQILNVGIASDLARRDGLSWLLHIDSDELFYSSDDLGMLFAQLSEQQADTVQFQNFEAVPEALVIDDFFRQVDLFKIPAFFNPGPTNPDGWRILNAATQLQPGRRFLFYDNGKSAVRLGAQGVRPAGVHSFVRTDGDTKLAPTPAAYILHYACCGFEAFWRKYQTLGHFAEHWFGDTDIRNSIGPFHLDARDIVGTGDRQKARDFYSKRVAILDTKSSEELIRHQVLMRISEPRRLLSQLQPCLEAQQSGRSS